MLSSFTPSSSADHIPRLSRRAFMTLTGSGLLVALAGCGTVRPTGEGGGASSSASGLVGKIRSSAGLPAMAPDSQLEHAALQQARYMAAAGRMEHTTGWGKDFASRVSDNGIEGAAAENIAQGRMDLARLFDMWMNSPPHRRNMLDPRFTRFGLAYVADAKRPDWRYWALLMGK
ncbi:CAP domain-containing protein [Mesorhizobium sp. UC22_110]|uniref:CAP domain-containing protein n=1 Tax=unclassified Mesorhizobium TaxID=325217 RepID=UPI00366B3893